MTIGQDNIYPLNKEPVRSAEQTIWEELGFSMSDVQQMKAPEQQEVPGINASTAEGVKVATVIVKKPPIYKRPVVIGGVVVVGVLWWLFSQSKRKR